MVYRNWFFYIEGGALKKIFILVCCMIIAFATANICFAHPGGTDENGGHYVGNSGKYHYHHGESAHQHPNGVCPYEIEGEELTTRKDCGLEGCTDTVPHDGHILKDTTTTTQHTEESEYNSKKEEKSTLAQVIEGVIDFAKEFGICLVVLLGIYGLIWIIDYFKNK